MKPVCLYAALALLLVSECFLLWNSQKQKKEIALKNNYIERVASAASTMESAYTISVMNAGAVIDGAAIAKDTAGNPVALEEIAKSIGGSFLICRYSERMCKECVNHSISVLTDSIKNLDSSRLLFLAGNASRRVFKLSIEEQNLTGLRAYNIANLGIPAEEEMFPYIMAVDSSLRVLSVYFPTKSTHGTDYDFRHVKLMYDKLVRKD